ncbi:DsrE family protein [Marinobacter sp. 1Y8]
MADRRFLFVIDTAPYGHWKGREMLDMAFSAAAFDQPAALLFTQAGVNWLRAGQLPDAIQQKSVSKNLSAATLFGLEAIYACQPSLERFGIGEPDPGLELVALDSISDLEARFTDVIRL